MGAFTGTWTLIRFILRRDRIRIPIWIVGFMITIVGSAAIFPDTYPTEADRQARAALIENPAMRIMFGPAHGLDDYTFGAMMTTEMLGLSVVVIALMSIFMITRHTRAEEESGRAELVRSSVVGPHAGLSAALITVVAVNLIIGITVALGLSATLDELGLEGSLLYGGAMSVIGIVFAVITAVSVQINEFARGANGLSLAILAVSYVLTGFGAMLENFLAWTPPFGLIFQTAPYVEDRWWPLAIAAALAALLVPIAFALSTRRDVAAALRPPRPGPAHASAWLAKPLGMVVRMQRGSLIAWTAGVTLFAALYGGIITEVGEQFAENPMVVDYFEALGIGVAEVTESIISMVVLFFALAASIFTVSTVTNLRGEETSLRAENVLATPVSRIRWAAESVTLGVVASTAILVLAGLGGGLVYAIESGDVGNIWTFAGATVVYAPALWLAAGVAVAVFGLFPRAMVLAWFVPVYGFFALMLGPLLGLPEWLYNLSPFEYVPRVPAVDFDAVPLLIMTAIAAGLIVAGLFGVNRRDMNFT